MCEFPFWVSHLSSSLPLLLALTMHSKHRQQRQSTYINDQTSDPYWLDQIFLLDVPVDPSNPIRGFSVSLQMKSRSLIGRDSFLGEADIPLTTLVSQQELCGWFALKPQKYSQQTTSETALDCGSIRVRIQWIHSFRCLIESVERLSTR
jgi:hypothetical protein